MQKTAKEWKIFGYAIRRNWQWMALVVLAGVMLSSAVLLSGTTVETETPLSGCDFFLEEEALMEAL